jgi:maltose O-acetyltransferase
VWTPRDFILRLRDRLLIEMEKAELRRIKSSLALCGAHVSIRLPTVIEFPHRVYIEDNVSINGFVHMWGNGEIRIGERTMIASHVAISSATHVTDAKIMSKTLVLQPVVIEHDVWIGAHAVILPGITIGAHAVVAAGSVVRENVEPYSVVAGVPAKVVRKKSGGLEPGGFDNTAQ